MKKFKKVKLAANFQGFDPRKASEALTKSNKIKKAKAKDASKLVTAKRTAKQRDDESTLQDRETPMIKIVERPSLPNLSLKKIEDLRNPEDDTQSFVWPWDELESTTATAATMPSTKISTPNVVLVNKDFYTADSTEENEANNDTNVSKVT